SLHSSYLLLLSNPPSRPYISTLSLHDALPILFLTLMRPSLVLFLVLWLKLVKDFLKVRCRLALLPFLISCLIWLDLVASPTKSSNLSEDRKSGSAGMPRPISYAVFCLKKKKKANTRSRRQPFVSRHASTQDTDTP